MSDPTYPLFSVFAFLGCIISLIPLPWHIQAWNSGTCYYMIWTSLACLNQFVNSVVWAGNAINSAPIWCDISTRIMLGSTVGIPAASVCIMRRLYKISSVHAVTIGPEEKRRAILIDSLICVLFPMIFIAVQFFVQGHRFNIYEDIGCYPALVNSIPAYFLSSIWPIILGLISAVYCILSLRAFLRRRAQFRAFLSSNNSLTAGRYIRLMALAMTEMFCTTPFAAFVIWLNVTAQPVTPWKGLADAHFQFSYVRQFPAILWRQDYLLSVALELTRWSAPVCAIVFFGFFGFAEEARRHYRVAFWAIAKPFGFLPPSPQSSVVFSIGGRPCPKLKPLTMSSTTSLPIYDIKRPTSSTPSLAPSMTSSITDLADYDIECYAPDATLRDSTTSTSHSPPSSSSSATPRPPSLSLAMDRPLSENPLDSSVSRLSVVGPIVL